MSQRIPRASRILPAMVAAGLLAGCGGEEWTAERPKPVPVSGKVVYNQQPVPGATVVFVPEDHSHAAAGETDAEGRFRVKTYGTHEGAVPGSYKITVRKVEASSPAGNAQQDDDAERPSRDERSLIPDRYSSPASSDLTANVTEGGENEFTLELLDGPAAASARQPQPQLRSGE